MATAVACQHCGQRYSVREDLLGKQMKCKACGQATCIVAAPPRLKRPTEAAPSKPNSSPKAAAPAKAKSAEPGALKLERTTPARPGAPDTQRAPARTAPSGANASTAPQGIPAAAPTPNILDLLDDTAFSAASAPLTSGVVLKAGAPAPIEKPKAKKKRKKKKSGSGGLSDNQQVLLRMSGGAFLVLLGLLAIGRAVYAIVSRDDENAAIGFLVGRWIIGGVSSISGGLKLICG